MTSCTVHVYNFMFVRMSTQCVKEGVHCGVAVETLPDRVLMLPVENYPNPIPEENATRLSPISNSCFGFGIYCCMLTML